MLVLIIISKHKRNPTWAWLYETANIPDQGWTAIFVLGSHCVFVYIFWASYKCLTLIRKDPLSLRDYKTWKIKTKVLLRPGVDNSFCLPGHIDNNFGLLGQYKQCEAIITKNEKFNARVLHFLRKLEFYKLRQIKYLFIEPKKCSRATLRCMAGRMWHVVTACLTHSNTINNNIVLH
jgi:hypothetical protein